MRTRWSDAWILAAVEWAGGGDLAQIIGAADAINHAIPTIEEVEHAVKFLGAAGLVRFSNNSIALTDEGKREWRRAESGDIFATLDRLEALLKNLPEVAPEAASDWVLDRSTYMSAYQRYMDEPTF
jgi:hypothetical protein